MIVNTISELLRRSFRRLCFCKKC